MKITIQFVEKQNQEIPPKKQLHVIIMPCILICVASILVTGLFSIATHQTSDASSIFDWWLFSQITGLTSLAIVFVLPDIFETYEKSSAMDTMSIIKTFQENRDAIQKGVTLIVQMYVFIALLLSLRS